MFLLNKYIAISSEESKQDYYIRSVTAQVNILELKINSKVTHL